MSIRRGTVAHLAAVCTSSVVASTSLAAQTPCVRPPAQQVANGTTIVLKETKSFPCTIRFASTGVVLKAGAESKVDDIGPFVARGADGRLYTSRDGAGQVTVWSAGGTFIRNVGRPGSGPGEFALGPKFIKFDSRGRMLVGDNNRRFSIFSPTFDFIGSISSSDVGLGLHSCCAMLDDDTYLTSYGNTTGTFRIVDLNKRNGSLPALVRAFGPAVQMAGVTRPVAYAAGSTFWAGGSTGAPFEYVLELWQTDGTRVRTLRREVPWIPKGGSIPGTSSLPAPELQLLHDDGTGLLFVSIMVPTKAYGTLTPEQLRDRRPGSVRDKTIENYFEVIDANAGVVLASAGPFPPSELVKQIPWGFFRKSRQGYQRLEDADGFPRINIVEAKLLAR